MVAFVAGAGTGLERTSAWVLGSRGQLGSASFGRFGENVYVNAANGNLVINRVDEILVGKGPDNILSRTYNSQGCSAYNQLGSFSTGGDTGDNWQLNASRRVMSYTGNSGHTSGTITLCDWDGSSVVYTWTGGSTQAYVNKEGAGSYDKLEFDATNSEWIWTDGTTQIRDYYSDVNTNGGRIKRTKDTDGNKLSYSYTSGRLTEVKTDNDEKTTLTWDATYGTLTMIETKNSSGTIVLTRVRYEYNGNRLSKVITDLSPDDNDDDTGTKVETTYTYTSGTDRLVGISQSDGTTTVASISFHYDGSGRVDQITQAVEGSTTRVTDISYAADTEDATKLVTTINDALDNNTKLTSNNKGELVKVELPSGQIMTFNYYNSGSDVKKVIDAGDKAVFYGEYDSRGNLTLERDEAGNTITRTYSSKSELLTETRYRVADPDDNGSGTASEPMTTRFAYDSENHLRFIISAEGEVTRFDYNSDGSLQAKIVYRGDLKSLSGLGAGDPISESTMVTWCDSTAANKDNVTRTNYTYDSRGNVDTATTFGHASATDTSGLTDQPYTLATTQYDRSGNLLSRIISGLSDGVAGTQTFNTETFTYDGLWRITSSHGMNGDETAITFSDGNNQVAVTFENGLVRTSTYNLAGELVTYVEDGSGGEKTTSYKYDAAGRLRMVTDPLEHSHYYLYDEDGKKIADIAHDGSMTEYRYDSANRLVKTIGYAERVSETDLDSLVDDGVPAEVTLDSIRPSTSGGDDPDVREWRVYDDADRLVEIVDAEGGCTVFTYDGASRPLTTTQYFNKLEGEAFDDFKEDPTTVALPTADSAEDNVTRNYYDDNGRLEGTVDGAGYLRKTIYNGAGQVVETIAFYNKPTNTGDDFATVVASVTTDDLDVHTRNFYDGRGFLRYTLDPNLRVTEYRYDPLGNVLNQIEYKNSVETETAYSFAYVQEQTEDEEFPTDYDRASWFVYNGAGERTYTIDAEGGVTRHVYDHGRIVRQIAYDELRSTTSSPTNGTMNSWASSYASSDDRVTRAFFDLEGRLVYQVDAEGYVTEFGYDDADQLTLEIRYAEQYSVDDSDTTETMAESVLPADPPDSAIQIGHTYDPVGRLVDTTDGEGVLTHLEYDGLGRVTTRTVSLGDAERVTAYGYDDAGRLEKEIFAPGEDEETTTQYQYDGLGHVTDVTRALGTDDETITHYKHDNVGNVVFEVQAYDTDEASATRYTYDAFGNVTERTAGLDQAGTDDTDASTTSYEYDTLGRVTREVRGTEVEDGLMTIEYDYTTFGDLKTRIVAPDTDDEAVTQYEYDGLGRVTSETHGVGTDDEATTTYEYDAFGNLTTVTDALENETTYEFDRRGLSISVTDALDNTTDYTYDAFRNLVKVRYASAPDDSRASAYFFYDKLGRQIWHIDQENYATETKYTMAGEVKSVTRYFNRVGGEIDLDVAPVVVETAPGEGAYILSDEDEDAKTSFNYDALGHLTKTTDAEDNDEDYDVNGLGQRTETTNKLGGATSYTYDARGLLTSETVTITSYDFGDDEHLDPHTTTITTEYEYDRRGNRTKMTEAAGADEERVTDYVYDELDRLTATKHEAFVHVIDADTLEMSSEPDRPIERILYDARGNMIESRDAADARTFYYYDALDRKVAQIAQVDAEHGTLSAWTYYDDGSVETVKVYDELVDVPDIEDPRPETATPVFGSGFRETHYTYDGNGRLTETEIASLWAGEIDDENVFALDETDITIVNQYDNLGNVVRQQDGRGNDVFFYYDRLNRKIAQVDQESYLTFYTLDADGNVTKEERFATSLSNAGTPVTPEVDSDPADLRDAVEGNDDDRITEFKYDRNGHRIEEKRLDVVAYYVENDGGSGDGTLHLASGDATITYTYNALGLVLSKTEATGDTTSYDYDDAGRQIGIIGTTFTDFDDDSVTPVTELTYDGLNNLKKSVQVGLDGDKRTTVYTYDEHGRLASVKDAENFERFYDYDIAGRVVAERYTRHDSADAAIEEANVTKYDAAGRVIEQFVVTFDDGDVDETSDRSQTQYNAHGEVSARGVNDGWQETFEYDAGGRMWKCTAGDGTTRLYLYDGNGAQTAVIASSGGALDDAEWSDFTSIDDAIDYIEEHGGFDAPEAGDGMVLTITVNDRRGQATETRELARQIGVDEEEDYVVADIVHRREYNAFGEVSKEIDPRYDAESEDHDVIEEWSTDYFYNTLGKLIRRESPRVDWTGEDGVTHEAGDEETERPTEKYYYDLSGRLLGVKDANDNVNSRLLLAGSGYGGTEAKVLKEFHADGGVYERQYDIYGDLRREINEVNKKEEFFYDKMGRLTEQRHEKRSSDPDDRLIDSYGYDELGRRTAHWNNKYFVDDEPTYADRTDYDAQGRVTQTVLAAHVANWEQRDFEDGDVTAYGYSWSESLATAGLGTFGGWTKTTTNAAGRTMTEKHDYFGRLVDKQDLGLSTAQHDYDYTYDLAGRLAEMAVADGVDSGDDAVTNYSYYNTSLISGIAVDYASGQGIDTTSAYAYDRASNRTHEEYVVGATTYEAADVEYNAMNRMTSLMDASEEEDNGAPHIEWKYDLNGNIRYMRAEYRQIAADGTVITTGEPIERNYWYKYDSMNRFVLTQGELDDGEITGGTSIGYNKAGQRTSSESSTIQYHEYDPDTLGGNDEQNLGFTQKETYHYSTDGYLKTVDMTFRFVESGPLEDITFTMAEYERDELGRVTDYAESQYNFGLPFRDFGGDHVNEDVYTRSTTFDEKSHILEDVTQTPGRRSTTTYDYDAESDDNVYEGAYMGGIVTHQHTLNEFDTDHDSEYDDDYTNVEMRTHYEWWDSARQSHQDYDEQSHTGALYPWHSDYEYDALGNLTQVVIDDGHTYHDTTRNIDFTNDVQGRVLKRYEDGGTDTENDPIGGNPLELHYYFNGMRVGDVGNNGTSNIDYAQSIAEHLAAGGSGAFRNGDLSGTQLADFDQSYDPVNGLTYESTALRYTVAEGDTLESIAFAVWGDASLWFKIADANALFGGETLAAGTELIIPNKVHNFHNTSDVYRVYDPNEAIGNTSPSMPKPPKNADGCSVMGQIMIVVVAIAVAVATQGLLAGPMASLAASMGFSTAASAAATATATATATTVATVGASGIAASSAAGIAGSIAAGAIGGAVGSMVSQGIGMLAGTQSKFDWGGVAMSAIGGGVGAGMGSVVTGVGVGADVLRGVLGNAITQGIGVATGLQKKFDWAGVAAAGVMAAVSHVVSDSIDGHATYKDITLPNGSTQTVMNTPATLGNQFVSGMAGMFAGAATRSLVNGSDFGDNIMAMLPDLIGQTIGNAIAEAAEAESDTMKAPEPDKDGGKDLTSGATTTSPRATQTSPSSVSRRYIVMSDAPSANLETLDGAVFAQEEEFRPAEEELREEEIRETTFRGPSPRVAREGRARLSKGELLPGESVDSIIAFGRLSDIAEANQIRLRLAPSIRSLAESPRPIFEADVEAAAQQLYEAFDGDNACLRPEIAAAIIPRLPIGMRPAAVAGNPGIFTVYNVSTSRLSNTEREAVEEYARRTNAWIVEYGPATVQSTAGMLRSQANAATRNERLEASRSGEPYQGQAGHVPDTALTGNPRPPAGWLDMPGISNSTVGGGLSSRIGETVVVITVDGRVP